MDGERSTANIHEALSFGTHTFDAPYDGISPPEDPFSAGHEARATTLVAPHPGCYQRQKPDE